MTNKNSMLSGLFVLLGVAVIVGSAYVIISYASDILGAIVDFVTTNSYTKLQQCGITPPEQFNKIKADLTSLILPFLYLGIPMLLIVISFLMFTAGQFYYRGKHEEDENRTSNMEKAIMARKEAQKETAPSKPSRPSSGMKTMSSSSEEEEEEELPRRR